ncbi:response regulator transcription factor [Ideonella sp. BN130291]|uniref:response regulator transcription factor n=1 Tax=Ideonella sp. BN130291 TaxID=3112940 RepID=UPI002E26054C|nr:response regulator transcription factor [Ideonella sp. BN130291]
MDSLAAGKPNILVVDDEPDMVALLQDLLQQAGFDADGAFTGAQALQAIGQRAYALVLMDLRLKGEDGLTLARRMRQASRVPIVMLSGRSDETDRVLTLELAADDFLTKPFSPRELIARLRAVLRRTGAADGTAGAREPMPASGAPGEQLRFDQWVLDLRLRELRSTDGRPCGLTQAEFRLLEAFVRHPQRVWSRDELLLHTRSIDTEVFDRTIDVLILRLRRKIEPDPRHPRYIRTERGLGYLFAAKVDKLTA